MDLKDKTAIVTGGSSGIGQAIAVKFANVINTSFSADFSASVEGDEVTITTVEYGETEQSIMIRQKLKKFLHYIAK